MNIKTVRDNLKNTIAGKELLLVEFQTQPTNDRVSQVVAQFMQINLDELNRILADVEQSCETREIEGLKKDLILVDTLYRESCAHINVLREALEESKSVCNSVNKSSYHEIKIDGEKHYVQTEEWVNWLHLEMLPMIENILATTPAQCLQEHDKDDNK